ncbi:MAG: sugar phosphate isomerase/epimerase [Chloroflexi bacterium]|nr:sugar phosphate isomerase/epimerase [Chloroflexota bacterium]
MKTRTGNYPIGFRRGGTEWQRDIDSLIVWAKKNDLEAIDLGKDANVIGQKVLDAGLRIGSVDLRETKGMISPDRTTREKAVEDNAEFIHECSALGQTNFFLVMLPEKPQLPRAENFEYMVDSFSQLAPILEKYESQIVIEGWPGPGALCCTPEGYRALFSAIPSKAMGINYDPSHLLRMGIDPLRFLREFGDRVFHAHGKDTEILTENQYEYCTEQPATFMKPISFGAHSWRYTIPGHGITRWVEVMNILQEKGYQGGISIELEDSNFNGPTNTEQDGILQGARFLTGV